MRKVCFFCALLVLAACSTQNPVSDAPTMGWSSWNTFALDISEQLIKEQADAMVSTGLASAGYKYINIDDGYFYGRDEFGHLLVNPDRFPSGMRYLTDYIHSLGLLAGIYTDAGRGTCGWNSTLDPLAEDVGMYGHDYMDAHLFFNDYNFDFIKVDFCGGSPWSNRDTLDLSPRERYTDIAKAIEATGRKNVRMNACRWAYPGTWITDVCGSWRTTGDITARWNSVRYILSLNLFLSDYSCAGHFNDMDMLEVGRGLPLEEDRTHFGLWCVMNSPLLIGCDMRNLAPESLELLSNTELIAVNQDKTFQQAYVAKKVNSSFILVRDVEKLLWKTRVVAIYNPSDEDDTVSFALSDIDLDGEKTTLRDLFNHTDATAQVFIPSTKMIVVDVPAHATRIYKVTGETRLERRRYEAETAFNPSYQDLVNNQVAGTGTYAYSDVCSGGIKATCLGKSENNSLHFRHVESRNGGKYILTVGYLCQEQRAMQVMVNGVEAQRLILEPDPSEIVSTVTFEVNLKKGQNTIVLTNSVDWMPDIDYIDLTPAV